jgi:hypothetical protein
MRGTASSCGIGWAGAVCEKIMLKQELKREVVSTNCHRASGTQHDEARQTFAKLVFGWVGIVKP